MRLSTAIGSLLLFPFFTQPAVSQECSATVHCATGCCSQFGFCGTDDAHCGKGCLSTCDYKLGCDASNPCADGTCCSKFGFCGLGKDYCSSENCVAGCDVKADCDPGTFGADYVIYETCPLNVCCSKWGYCGTTSEFCGNQTVNRPSCDSGNSVTRVVGYYEGWASRRMCQSFQPENVPIGVYTHINFAFASIDPNTFAVVPADSGDVDLYTRITNLKKQDQALKVYIAIGGWTFNDPGPTAKTFSNLVGSIANQQAFFRSLISLMSTYNFDGVDIDWEYPVADDRSGSPEDYANYPAFLRNLKLALLASSGGRSGVTVTLPVSYWYLQNFDISSMEPWVDWFNVMSYDLHGLWDKDNKWLGPFLNSHTNLTEISEYLDLLWRNDIPPSKVNLGLAFYTRTFVASDPGCMQPACLFDAVGSPGPCTNNAGTLSNAELTNMVRNAGVTPTLDKDAAVQIAAVGRNWITYDDAESWALKLDFARGVCLGGVMVWAISEDYTDGTYSKQLQSVTQYRSPSVISNIIVGGDGGTGSTVDGPTSLVLRNQCMWANCGQSCPAGYSTVPRKDNSGSGIMNDGSRCRGGQLRTFCCPANERIPTCGWYDFNNGKCGKKFNSVCPAGSEQIIGPYSTEVGSTGIACNNGGFQVACCETKPFVTTDLGYASCQWDGTPPDCNDNRNGNDPVTAICRQYDSEFSYALFASPAGDGAVHCNGGYDRMYCCNPPTTEAQWLSCSWVFPNHHDDGFCEAYCPAGTVRLAMKDPEVYFSCSGNQGGWAYCCTPMFLSEAENDDETGDAFSAALVDVVQNGCDWTFDSSSPISRSLETFFNTSSGNSSETSLEKRGASSYNCELAYADTYNMLGTIDLNARIPLRNGWDDAMQVLGIDSLPATVIAVIPNPDAFRQMDLQLQVVFVKALLSMVPELSAKVSSTFVTLVCPWWWVADLGLTEDPDDGGLDPGDPYQRRKRDMLSMEELPIEDLSVDELPVDELPVDELPVDELPVNELPVEEISKETKKTRSADPLDDVDLSGFLGPFNLTDIGELFKDIKRGLAELQERFENDLDALSKANADVDVVTEPEELLRSIEERAQTGSSRSYKVTSQKYNTQQWPPLTVRSSPYPNGDGGDSLIDATNDNSRYIVVSKGCGPTDYTLVTNAAKGASNKWVSEHILELQTIPRFLTALLDGQLAAVPSMDIPSEVFTTASTNTVRMFTQAFQTWTHETGNTISPADRALRYCGSTTDVDGMVVADASLNAIKGRLYGFIQPASDTKWASCCSTATRQAGQEAFSYLQNTMAVFDYYNDINVKIRHRDAYRDIKRVMADFEVAYFHETSNYISGHMTTAWQLYMQRHTTRVVTFAVGWSTRRLTDLSDVWSQSILACIALLDPVCLAEGIAMLMLVQSHIGKVRGLTSFDTTIFT